MLLSAFASVFVLALAGAPVGVSADDNIFMFWVGENFTGTRNTDDVSSLNRCENPAFKKGVRSLRVYDGYKCTVWMDDDNCTTGTTHTYEAGKVAVVPEEYNVFKSYKCVRDA